MTIKTNIIVDPITNEVLCYNPEVGWYKSIIDPFIMDLNNIRLVTDLEFSELCDDSHIIDEITMEVINFDILMMKEITIDIPI